MTLTRDELRSLPKVSLHDHLDGGLRPATVLELAADAGWTLPRADAAALGDWFFEAADSGSLPRYLETFDQTIAVMQTADNLRRVAREYVEDLAADGVVYGETRWAPEQHLRSGLTLRAAVAAVSAGLAEGMDASRTQGRPIEVRQLLTSMRHLEPTTTIARLTVECQELGVVGFDLAGAEAGFPPGRFLPAFDLLRAEGVPFTIHAGEAAGTESIADALACGAARIGHGVRIIDDVDLTGDRPRLGALASEILERGIPLEVCPTSNVQTGVCATIAEHPIGRLVDLGFTVTVSCDNRLMSRTTLTDEFAALAGAFGYGLNTIRSLTLDAARNVFLDQAGRDALVASLPGAPA